MPTATLTTKGQGAIPLAVRREIGLRAGDRVEFVRGTGGHYSLVPASYSVKSLKGRVPAPKTPVSIDDMNAAIIAGACE